MILLDIPDIALKQYSKQLSYMTYDFNMDNDLDIKTIAKNEEHFNKWVVNYPFYANVRREGVVLYGESWEYRDGEGFGLVSGLSLIHI